jgi:serine protease Do
MIIFNIKKLLASILITAALVQTVQAQTPPTNSPKTSFGTGFAVSSEYILTAYHIVVNKQELWVGPVEGKSWTRAQLIKAAPELDLALLSANVNAKPLALASWDDVPIGLEVFVIGYPQPTLQGLSKKITQGIINGMRSEKEGSASSKLFQFSAEVNKGNSGGPIIAADGVVVGMVQKKLDALGVAERTHDLAINVNYGLKSNYLVEFLNGTPAQKIPQAVSLRSVLRPYQIYAQHENSVFAVLGRDSKD